ncbi:MAG: phosphoribosyltransferase family protein [Actinomycetota bacterium]|nr:phosphoribosyltransferase family protein [Actinomycetota bacterium]
MTPYPSFGEAGRLLGAKVLDCGEFFDACVIGLNARGQIVGAAVAAALRVACQPVAIVKSESSVATTDLPDTLGRTVVIVDDGVESGSAARTIGREVRATGASKIILAVPVCPERLMEELAGVYDELVILHACTDAIGLDGHYQDFDRLS